MQERQKPITPPTKREVDVADVIWGNEKGTYATQAISDSSNRQAKTGVAIPHDDCVSEAKNWVDHNEK